MWILAISSLNASTFNVKFIYNCSIPLGIKPKCTFNEVSQEMDLYKYINKQLPPDVTKFDEIPDESKYYKTVRNENFITFKSLNLVIFQPSFQEKLFMKYNEDIFEDGIFHIAPKYLVI
ncbi:hypothetical protein H8356DRAFT_1356467 [Neocallimastix lanati (nom. inval.)]|nr:hypothetical protein H8356DRAFT_1356467 [Neocallimastix sp. JGI-2020a]